MLLITDEELEHNTPAPLQPDLAPRTQILPGVRARLKQWLGSQKQDVLIEQCRCVGMYYKDLWKYANNLNELPSLRVALSLELLTLGQVRVHDWVEVMEMKERALEAMKLDTINGLRAIGNLQWPPSYSDDACKRLRWEIARRLTRPEDNLLGIVVNMGRHEIKKTERIKALANQKLTPPVVSPDATEQEVEREVYFYRRKRDKRASYKAGTRRDF